MTSLSFESDDRIYSGVDEVFSSDSSLEGGARLLDDIVTFLRRFVVLTEAQAFAIALWVVHSHAFAAALVTPYLYIRSPEKRSGKTRLLEVLQLLVANPWRTGRTSVAALIRKVSEEGCSMLHDEVDAAFSGDRTYAEALRGVLNDGYSAGGNATLCVGQGSNIKAKSFPVFSPKAFAGIGNHLPDTVADRSIKIELRRRTRAEGIERFKMRRVTPQAEQLRLRIADWAVPKIEKLRELEPAELTEINDRAEDLWEPLLAIAELAGPEPLARARRVAVALSGGRDLEDAEDGSNGVALLCDIQKAFGSDERIHSSELLRRLTSDAFSESPWSTWHHGKPMSARVLANLLRPYGIRSRQLKIEEQNLNGYRREDFKDAWKRYVPIIDNLSSTDSTSLILQGKTRNFASSTEGAGREYENAEIADETRAVDLVEDKTARDEQGASERTVDAVPSPDPTELSELVPLAVRKALGQPESKEAVEAWP
jgi:hypothetical protein